MKTLSLFALSFVAWSLVSSVQAQDAQAEQVNVQTEELAAGCRAVLTRGEIRRVLELDGTCDDNQEAIQLVVDLMAEGEESDAQSHTPQSSEAPSNAARSNAAELPSTIVAASYRTTRSDLGLASVSTFTGSIGYEIFFNQRIRRIRLDENTDLHMSIPVEFRYQPTVDRISFDRSLVAGSTGWLNVQSIGLLTGICAGFGFGDDTDLDVCGKANFRLFGFAQLDGGERFEFGYGFEVVARGGYQFADWIGIDVQGGLQLNPTASLATGSLPTIVNAYRPNEVGGILSVGVHLSF